MSRKSTIGFAVVAIVLGLLAAYGDNLKRLYMAITLYDEDKIAHNFVSMPAAFKVTTLAPSSQPYVFPRTAAPAPTELTLQDPVTTETVADFLIESRTTSLLVIAEGAIVYEYYGETGAADRPHISFSVAKSFVSALVGIAVEQGYIEDINQLVVDYVPELATSGYQPATIKDVLQMSSGVRFNEDYADFNSDINRFSRAIAFGSSLDDFTASLESQRSPGQVNHYVSIDTQVLGMVLVRATQQSLTEYAQKYLWEPLGMQDTAFWLSDDDGMELALGGLNVTARDYAKFGWLYANQGRFNGQQVVPESWVYESTHATDPHVLRSADADPSSPYGYGYQWWLPPGSDSDFMARGIYHQYIYIAPDAKVVIVKTSANHRFNDRSLNWSVRHLQLFRRLTDYYSNAPSHDSEEGK